MTDWMASALIGAGVAFFIAGSAGLLRFPDTLSRLHALTKADNVGLGLICAGLAVWQASLFEATKLLFIWLAMLAASATGSHLLARTVVEEPEGHGDSP